MPLMGEDTHKHMIDFMTEQSKTLKKPDAILVLSAHWEEAEPTVITTPNPQLIYDYYGFPAETYTITYPSPGATELAEEISRLLESHGLVSRETKTRGLDHGVFVPLKMIFPTADIPVTQLSMLRSLNPEDHLKMGRALRELADKNILIIGSGFSFHNMGEFFTNEVPNSRNDQFQDWLIDTCTGDYSEEERSEKLINWEKAPGARFCHPREEHLLPLHVCAGISGEKGEVIFDNYIAGKRAVAFKW